MRKHTKLYMDAFGYDIGDFIPSEISGSPSNDLHHIECRGIGGTKEPDRIENLIALTREEHLKWGDVSARKKDLYLIHRNFMDANGVKYDKNYFKDKI